VVIHNPGVVPKANPTVPQIDVTAVFEWAYRNVPIKDKSKSSLAVLPGSRSNYRVLIHGLPKEFRQVGLRKLINSMHQNVA